MIFYNRTKWLRSVGLGALLLLPLTASATVSITLSAGYLRQNNTTALNSTAGGGALLLLVASGAASGTTFTSPSAGNYVGGSDAIVVAFGLNTSGGANGTGKETLNGMTGITYPSVPNGSAYVELLWFPNITLTDYTNGVRPTAGTIYGAYNPLVTNPYNATTNPTGNTTLNPDAGNAWQLPGNGATIRLNFYTSDDSGTQPINEGYANFTVVPEPSCGILGGLGIVVVVGATRFWRRYKAI